MERLYTCEEIAQRYSVKVPTVWRWIRNKQLPAINLNGSGYRVSESDLVAFEESKRVRKMPEFSSEILTVADASQLIGLPITAIRAGIVYGWLPIGVAIQNNKPAKSLSGGRITYIISPRKVYEVTGHVWKGKAALNK